MPCAPINSHAEWSEHNINWGRVSPEQRENNSHYSFLVNSNSSSNQFKKDPVHIMQSFYAWSPFITFLQGGLKMFIFMLQLNCIFKCLKCHNLGLNKDDLYGLDNRNSLCLLHNIISHFIFCEISKMTDLVEVRSHL